MISQKYYIAPDWITSDHKGMSRRKPKSFFEKQFIKFSTVESEYPMTGYVVRTLEDCKSVFYEILLPENETYYQNTADITWIMIISARSVEEVKSYTQKQNNILKLVR